MIAVSETLRVAPVTGLRTRDRTGQLECARPTSPVRPNQKATEKTVDLDATISELIALQRQRQFCIASQNRCDRSVESFIAKMIGMPNSDDDAEDKAAKLKLAAARKAVFAKAAAFRKAVEKGGEGRVAHDGLRESALSAAVPFIILSARSRESWDKHRRQVEIRMDRLSRSLPVHGMTARIKGFGERGLAIIVGETGNLTNYATKERVWKRLGLAVIEGERQGKRATPEEAAKHGYNPRRRGEIWTIADSLFRHQWRGEKDDVPAHPTGRYGEAYAARKAHTAERDGWTAGHRDADARRIMTKLLIEDLWKAWRRSTALPIDSEVVSSPGAA